MYFGVGNPLSVLPITACNYPREQVMFFKWSQFSSFNLLITAPRDQELAVGSGGVWHLFVFSFIQNMFYSSNARI